MKPQEIERLSFSMIDKEAGDHGFSMDRWPIVRRMIHTSADFEYIRTVRFHADAVSKGIRAIQKGCAIFTDTNMARVGIRKGEILGFGGATHCYISDADVCETAAANGITRAEAAVDKAASSLEGSIYVVGNAPTALLRIIGLLQEKKIRPALVIGFPVGFVNAAESKEELIHRSPCPFISNQGRKGGSNIAASIVNALAIMAAKQVV